MTRKEDNLEWLNHAKAFLAGAVAACGAVTFTNPWEVVKTRLQLQGELQKISTSSGSSGVGAAKPYPNAVSAFVKIARTEGLSGIQRGLAPAYAYQVMLNGTRFGLYDPLRELFKNHTGMHQTLAMVASGALSGVSGAFLASPLFLVKTRMQSFTPYGTNVVGHQHSYVQKGALFSLRTIFKNEGVLGLWRGVEASMLRTGIGSAVQLSSYDTCKSFLLSTGLFHIAEHGQGNIELHFLASLATSFLVCLAMNPFDVASTRMYNQHTGADGKHGSLYKNGIDCLVKTVRSEGIFALYKGFGAHYLRIGPHTILTFVFLEQVKKLTANWK